MINSDDFIKRLEMILDYYSVSASAFADKIGVQRSALSHLLSGRNKPSLDFVLRIIESYPEVNLYWLLKGTGVFPKNSSLEALAQPSSSPEGITIPEDYNGKEKTEKTNIQTDNNLTDIADNKDIESITFFYKDGTFKNYKRE